MPADVYSSFANYLHLILGNLLISDEGKKNVLVGGDLRILEHREMMPKL